LALKIVVIARLLETLLQDNKLVSILLDY